MAKPVCSCGSTLCYESTKCSGWWVALVDGDGETVDTDLSKVKYGPAPKTAICSGCGKRVKNPKSQR